MLELRPISFLSKNLIPIVNFGKIFLRIKFGLVQPKFELGDEIRGRIEKNRGLFDGREFRIFANRLQGFIFFIPIAAPCLALLRSEAPAPDHSLLQLIFIFNRVWIQALAEARSAQRWEHVLNATARGRACATIASIPKKFLGIILKVFMLSHINFNYKTVDSGTATLSYQNNVNQNTCIPAAIASVVLKIAPTIVDKFLRKFFQSIVYLVK